MSFYKLKVSAVEKPIADATTITFNLPDSLYEKFNFHPGQHLIIKFKIGEEEVRRSYSLNSCPHTNEPLQVTVKRVKDGLVSNFLNDNLKVGDELEVMTPQGRFFANIEEDAYKTYFLFAAGSGITPIVSICKSVLHGSPDSVVKMLFGNKNQETIIFKKELEGLEKEFPNRLKIAHTLSNPKVWTSWKPWNGKKGRVSAKAVEEFITENPPVAQTTEYYICGPGAMNVSVKKTLTELGIPKELIHIEQFGGNVEDFKTDINPVENAKLTAVLNGKTHQLTIPKGKTILDVLKTSGAEPPYTCESGICGTCVAKLTSGKAEMKSCAALDDSDIEKGLILTCQALPMSDELGVEF